MYVKRYRHLYLLSFTLLICFVVLSLSYHTACIENFDNTKGSVNESRDDIAKALKEVMLGMLADVQLSVG